MFVEQIDVCHEVNKPFGLTDTVKFLQDISPGNIQHISSTGGMVYHGVVTSQQVCYIPAGMIVVSRTVGAAHGQNKTNIRETRVDKQDKHKHKNTNITTGKQYNYWVKVSCVATTTTIEEHHAVDPFPLLNLEAIYKCIAGTPAEKLPMCSLMKAQLFMLVDWIPPPYGMVWGGPGAMGIPPGDWRLVTGDW